MKVIQDSTLNIRNTPWADNNVHGHITRLAAMGDWADNIAASIISPNRSNFTYRYRFFYN